MIGVPDHAAARLLFEALPEEIRKAHTFAFTKIEAAIYGTMPHGATAEDARAEIATARRVYLAAMESTPEDPTACKEAVAGLYPERRIYFD